MLQQHSSSTCRSKVSSGNIFNYSKADWLGLEDSFLDADFSHCYSLPDVNSMWRCIKEIILQGCHQFIPKAHTKKSHLPRWFTPAIRHSLNKVRTLRRRVLASHYPSSLVSKLHKMESSLQSQICATKKAYEFDLIKNSLHNKRKLFKQIKSFTKNVSLPPRVNWNHLSSSDPMEKCELFNRFFNLVFVNSSYSLPDLSCLPIPSHQLNLISFTESDVWTVLASLDPDKANGLDNIGPRLLKQCATPLAAPLSILFNECISQGFVPDDWKIHRMVPVFKSGDKTDVTNYRPISLLSSTSKVLESLIFQKIIDFIRPQISLHQFGFLSNRSCLHKLLMLLYSIVSALDRKYQTDVIFLDIRKAFDTVCHKQLLFKLSLIGISGPLWSWFQSYLSNRSHMVRVDGWESNCLPVRSGVPQGSILGPLLFLVYINDMAPTVTFSKMQLYADDTQCIKDIHSRSDSDLLQDDLDQLSNWSSIREMDFNTDKCVSMSFGKAVHHSTYIYPEQICSQICHGT